MLTPDVRLEGFTTEDWVRLGRALGPPRRGEPPTARRGGVVAVTTGVRLRKLLHTVTGRLPLVGQAWPVPLETLAEQHGAGWAAALSATALDELMDRFAARLTREHDMGQQLIELWLAFRELDAEGAIAVWPRSPAQWPLPGERVAQRALDVLCPPGRTLLLGVFEGGALYTCLAARRRGAGFDFLLGPDQLRAEMGLLSGDFRRDQRHLARAVEQRVGPLGLGCYAEAATLQRLLSLSTPGAWAAAVATREVVMDPVTPGLAIPLGIDLGWAAFVTLRDLAERLGAGDWRDSPAVQRVREAWLGRASEPSPGFELLSLLRQLLSRRGA